MITRKILKKWSILYNSKPTFINTRGKGGESMLYPTQEPAQLLEDTGFELLFYWW
jgi:hypothetical protein